MNRRPVSTALLILLSVAITTACGEPTALGQSAGPVDDDPVASSDASDPGQPIGTFVYQSSFAYRSGGEDTSVYTFSTDSRSRWTGIAIQNGEVTCQARVGEYAWLLIDSDDCIAGTLGSVSRYDSDDTLVSVFPLTNPVSVPDGWINPPGARSIPAEDLEGRAASPIELEVDHIAAYRAEDDGNRIEWTMAPDDYPVPLWYRHSTSEGTLEVRLDEVHAEPRTLLEDVPDRIREAAHEQERILNETRGATFEQ